MQGTIAKTVPEVLFVCVQNAGRSQMAAALLEHYADGRVHLRSADPADTDLDGVRHIRDNISDRVRLLLAELTAPAHAR